MTQQMKESKREGTIQFHFAENLKPFGAIHPAMFHLLECDYGKDMMFWFGCADVVSTPWIMDDEAKAAKHPAYPEQSGCYHPIHFLIEATFDDGRNGLARVYNSDFRGTLTQATLFRIWFVPYTILLMPKSKEPLPQIGR